MEFLKKGSKLMVIDKPCQPGNIEIPSGCDVVTTVKTAVEGFGSKVCVLLEELRKKNKNNNVELFFLKDGKYYVKCKGRGGIINVPQEITTLSILLMMEYLNISPLCSICKVCLKKGKCPKTLFV